MSYNCCTMPGRWNFCIKSSEIATLLRPPMTNFHPCPPTHSLLHLTCVNAFPIFWTLIFIFSASPSCLCFVPSLCFLPPRLRSLIVFVSYPYFVLTPPFLLFLLIFAHLTLILSHFTRSPNLFPFLDSGHPAPLTSFPLLLQKAMFARSSSTRRC